MNKTNIEWCDSTWNPITGCLHGCKYCYARGMARRFGSKDGEVGIGHFICFPQINGFGKEDINPYPYGFDPTFHHYRLNDYKNKKGRTIFVCSMADMFGDWIPDEWISDIYDSCMEADQHRYLILTKNPKRYDRIINYYASEDRGSDECYESFEKFWFGTTVTCQKDLYNLQYLEFDEGHKFLSLEPLHEPLEIDLEKKRCPICRSDEIYQENKMTSIENNWYCDCCGVWEGKDNSELLSTIEWVIIGAETGNRKDKVIPKREWIESIVEQCDRVNVPVFMKDSLIPIMGEENMRREFPWKT